MAVSKDTLIGTTIEHFEIIDLIGRGGMSSVYLAFDRELERKVALKIPHARFIDSDGFVRRFKREAKAMARLRHNNIVQIYSVGNHGDMPYFAMEHINGESLASIMKKAPLKPDAALNYIAQIARAVEYAHRKDIIHRDIKPANILVDPSGHLLVTDFGVSKLLSDDTTQETMGFMGTPQYMSPEQCGQGTLDHRTDIYSLGIVFLEMLTGQAPFVADSPAETIKKQLFDTPEFPEEAKNRIPERIQSLVMRMLEKEPERRYPDIAALLNDIEALENECVADTGPLADRKKNGGGNGAVDAKDFISRIEAHRTRWPLFVVAGALAVLLVVFGTSFILSEDSQFSLDAMTALFSTDRGQPGNRTSPGPEPGEPGEPAPAANAGETPQALPDTGNPTDVASVDRQPVAPAVEPPAFPKESPEAFSDTSLAAEPSWTEVMIRTQPSGAKVFFDSELMGTTPITITEVFVGTHMLTMKLEDYPDYSKEINALESEPTEVFHDFAAAKEALIPKGSLSIDSEPSGARVFLNGDRKGTTPLMLADLRADTYRIRIELDEYETIEKELILNADENLRMALNLVEKPKFGDLVITSAPDNARVMLNDAYKGTTPLTLRRMPVGSYELTLQKEGYESVRKELVCSKNKATQCSATLVMTPQFAALQKAGAGDNHMETGEFASAIVAYEAAIGLDPQQPVYHKKLARARQSLTAKEVHDLLTSYEFAYDSENTALLSSLLNEEDPEFQANQVSNADRLFQEFEDIDMTLSDIKITSQDAGEAAAKLHITISASFAETRKPVNLLETNQTLTLRKNSTNGWRICVIE